MRRILVLRGGALGDFIVTLPALALLRRQWPQARIELAGNSTAAQLALARSLIDAVHSQHDARWLALFADAPLPGDFSEWLGHFDLVLNYWPDADGTLSRHFPVQPAQRFVSAGAMPASAPAAAHYCEALRGVGIEPKRYFFPLRPLAGIRPCGVSSVPAPHPDNRYVAVHPGSGSRRKNWPWENWRRLMARLPGPLSLILGEAELERFEHSPAMLMTHAGGQPHCELRNRPLEELVDHFARCRLFLGHDSGISHLAAACGVRCVLLFGQTDPEMWAPPAPHVRVLHCNQDLALLPVESVQRAVEEALADQR